MILSWTACEDILMCPTCGSSGRSFVGDSLAINDHSDELVCGECGDQFPLIGGRQVLISRDNRVFQKDQYSADPAVPKKGAVARCFEKFMPSPSVNLSRRRVLRRLARLLTENGPSSILVVGGGRQREWLTPLLLAYESSHRIVYTDIDRFASVDFLCDGHQLPFVTESFDAVITTAVMEHVLSPDGVAAEISRVARLGALLYSELPFMQQVHEGAFDFTRFTHSGHMYLFRQFEEVESGLVAGPATALVWSIEQFFLAFARKPRLANIIKALTRLIFGWIKYFDFLLKNSRAALDGASCTYLLGRRVTSIREEAQVATVYQGAQSVSHV